MFFDFTNCGGIALAKRHHSSLDITRNITERNSKNRLPGKNFLARAVVRINEHNTTIQNVKRRFSPKIIPQMGKLLSDFSQMLKRYLGFISKCVEHSQRDKITK